MQYGELIDFLQNVGKDPSRLIFEDELTGLHNRRFLHSYFEHKIHWDRDDYFPLSLLVMDVDLFKAINDTYGHDAGDEALVFVAGLLKEVSGEEGYPIRFGGDEFMVLFPKTELQRAVRQADLLHQLTRDRRLSFTKAEGELHISLSIGVASARTDAASGNDLIRQADTALYNSKKLGRNRVSVARDTDPQVTFSRAALHRLHDVQIAGRTEELEAISEALAGLSQGASKLVVVEGAPGMGKTTLIEAIRRSLAGNDALAVVKVSGKSQEGFRPYYLVGQALVALMSRRTDKGVPVLDALDERELKCLSYVLPQLAEGAAELDRTDPARREEIFVALLRFLGKLLDGKPLVLLADDLHLADEASLVLLRVLFERREIPFVLCGSVGDLFQGGAGEESLPWESVVASRGEALDLEKLTLRPLTESDVAEHLAGVFPGIDLPVGFESELARTTSGNPLFLAEIVRKLVLDQKLVLVGQRWTVEPPEAGYLPKSLEEIVTQKIQALDGDSRKLLEHVSTLGEDVPLSVVTGAAEVSESQVLEFLDRAETLGLLRADFDINDETMRFLSKRVLEIAYGAIQPSRRQELHERVGTYHEELYQNRLGPSASILAYHFKLSSNQEKALRYDQIQGDLSARTFDSVEAQQYTGAPIYEDEEDPADERLPLRALEKLPNLFRTLLTTVRSVQLYPADSMPIRKAYQSSLEAVEAVLEHVEHVVLARAQGVLLANGHKVDAGEFRLLANSYLDLLDRAELESVEFQRGLTSEELRALLTHLGRLKPELIEGGYWKRFAAEESLEHVRLRQMRYSEIRRRRGQGAPASAPESGLAADEQSRLPHLLRALLGAVKNVKLYPLASQPVVSAIDHLNDELQKLLGARSPLTLAGAADALIVNGTRLTTAGFEMLADSFLSFMESSELSSLTFLDRVSREELEVFVGALKSLPHDLEPAFWQRLVAEKGLSGVAFNDRRYALTRLESALEAVETDAELDASSPEDAALEELSDEPADALIDALPTVGKELLLRGDHALARKVLRRVLADYAAQEPPARERILRACRGLLDALVQALQHQFATLASDFLLRALKEEDDDHLLGELANLLHQMTGSVLQFADYTLASRIFAELRQRQHDLMKTPMATGRGLAVLNRKLDASTRALLMEELQSKEPARQEQVAQVLESLGKPSIPILLEVIKQEKDFRTRQLAAGLLNKMGREAAEQIKREVVLEVTAEQRFRILEVIEVVTRDLKTELAFCLSDVNPKVRRAAFRLSERLADKQVLELLVDFARHDDIGVAKGAIRSLANLRSAHAVGALVSTLEVTKDPERAIACAQALAQLGDAVAVPALERVLTAKRFPLIGGKRWDDQVRATAAFALAQIGGDRARAALAKVADDADPRIRQIAHAGYSPRPVATEGDEEDDEDEGDHEGEGVA